MEYAINPLDGRYFEKTRALAPYFSEEALMKYRVMMEGEYLIALSEAKLKLRKFTNKEKNLIRSLYNLSIKDTRIISYIELRGYKKIKATDHDVKAVEYFIKDKLANTSLKDVTEWIHFALTSEDTNNIAYALILSDSLEKVMVPKIIEIINNLTGLAIKYGTLPMLARTHGQSASPTTFGKEMKVFAQRLNRGLSHLLGQKILVKLNGASGNYNAHVSAYPKVDWLKFSEKFIAGLTPKRLIPLEWNPITTQIEPHDSYIEIFDRLKRLNNMLIDLNQDIWRYISDEWIVQKPIEGTIGSSTMPHKINPIKFENSEGNLGLANALFEFFGRKLPISRLQRDLSDSTVQRNFGTAFSYSLVAYEYLLNGLSKIRVNETKIKEDLKAHPEIITEAIQTILRREGVKMPYEKLKELTRGKVVTLSDIHKFIDALQVSDKIKRELLKITPENYTGLASFLASI
ncbi:MAG TPA: adenylosuccinate lyase [Candidatus Paceibacterota bacterium]|nr:adenylosuccinate lyase [Candidatus Paceibacterota bacterium]